MVSLERLKKAERHAKFAQFLHSPSAPCWGPNPPCRPLARMSGAPRPVQPPGRPPDFNGLINGLLTDAPVPRRLQTAASLCTVLRAPENAAFVQQAFSQLLHAFEQMLYDRAEPIRWQAPLLLGALAAAVRPNLHPFVSWLLYTAQCAGQAQRTHTLWPLLLLIMREMLEALHHVGDTPCVLPYLHHPAGRRQTAGHLACGATH